MKQIKNLAWMSAIALAGTMTFAACSSDDDKVENINPTYDGKSVKTQFAINIPRAAQQTRQTAEITQNNSNFRGMQDIKLYSATSPLESETTLNPITLATSIENSIVNKKIYSDVTVPVGTSNFLFYGQATKEGTDFNNGVLNATYPNSAHTPGGISFALKPIYNLGLKETTLLRYLNEIRSVDDWAAEKNKTPKTQLGIAYEGFIKLKSGSSNSILKAVERLYNSVEALADGNAEAGTQGKIASDIVSKIEEYFDPDGEKNPYTLAYIDNNVDKLFPQSLDLPEGAAYLSFTEGTGEGTGFAYAQTAIIGDLNANTTTICYPAALYYYVNTTLRANNSDNPGWPTDLAGWIGNSWDGWENIVTATTRTIALKEPINYGVALLKTNVTTAERLEDNAIEQGGAASDKVITVGEETFPVTGFLIGGQPNSVDWEFNPSANREYTIYDNVMNGRNIYAKPGNTAYNYTMVLDNKAATEEVVNIAVELTNNSGQDFYGFDGIVPKEAKFYLVAQLNPVVNVEPGRVFAKDYVTTANLTITSLKKAYMTIPDLRSTKLQLGLAVDLSWKTGLTFDVNIGGDNQ